MLELLPQLINLVTIVITIVQLESYSALLFSIFNGSGILICSHMFNVICCENSHELM